jgi:hypothetical protein
MELIDKRKIDPDGNAKQAEPEIQYDDFEPTLEGFQPLFDAVLLRELQLPEEGMIATPDAYAEPCLYCEVIASADPQFRAAGGGRGGGLVGAIVEWNSDIVRILKGIGTTIQFSDAKPGQRYFTVHAQDIIGKWSR